MPYKANEPRRHKIPRARYKVRNWPEYDRALQQRGSLMVWVTPEALAAWHPPRTGQRGRPRDYSDAAIETGHLLRLALSSVAADRRPAALAHDSARGGCWCPRPHHLLPAQPWPDARYGAGASPGEWTSPRCDRRDWPEGLRRGRVAGGEARCTQQADLAQTS